jgi:hypothetical protein
VLIEHNLDVVAAADYVLTLVLEVGTPAGALWPAVHPWKSWRIRILSRDGGCLAGSDFFRQLLLFYPDNFRVEMPGDGHGRQGTGDGQQTTGANRVLELRLKMQTVSDFQAGDSDQSSVSVTAPTQMQEGDHYRYKKWVHLDRTEMREASMDAAMKNAQKLGQEAKRGTGTLSEWGYAVLAVNDSFLGLGELDFVVKKDQLLAFVELRTRETSRLRTHSIRHALEACPDSARGTLFLGTRRRRTAPSDR